MTDTLRDYQSRAVEHVRGLSGKWRRALSSPTGSGKTVIMADLLCDPFRQLVLSHRRILLDQTARKLDAWGIRYTYLASGYKYDPQAPVVLGMIQTALRRKMVEDVDIVHIDEIHCQRGPKYKAIFDAYHKAGASILGYTATPSDLGDLVDDVYTVATVPELIQQGYLCQPRVFGCGQPDVRLLEKLRRDAQGEYLAGDVSRLVKPHVIFGPVLDHYKRLSNGTPFVLFADCVKSSRWWAEHLTMKGVPTAHIDGDDVWVDGSTYKSDSIKRKEVFDRLEAGDLKGVSNRFVLREGWDLPCVGHAIITCPFGSRKTWAQACGRILRPHESKQFAVIQDHSGSCIAHPPLDSDVPWDWQSAPGLSEKTRISEMKNDVISEPIVCPKCSGVRATGSVCPYCGFHYEKRARYVLQLDGTLKLIEGKSYVRKESTYRPGDEKIAERLYHSARNSGRTAEQCIAYYAYSNNWRWLPRDLPFMPKYEGDFFIPWKNVPQSRLIPQKKTTKHGKINPGQEFTHLVVVRKSDAPKNKDRDQKWVCRCKLCGRHTEVFAAQLKNGKTKSCGCLRDMARKTHGMSKSAEYAAWKECCNRSAAGGDEKWRGSFEAFLNDMGLKPHEKARIARRDKSKPHGPGNSYWKVKKT